MSPHNDRTAPARWRRPLRAAAVVAIACSTAFCGVALAATSAGSRATASRVVLRVGSRGAAVKRLQRRLHVPATGYYGAQTKAAVKRFQRAHGLRADGVAGPATLRALGIRARPASYSTGGVAPPRPQSTTRLPAVLQKIAQCESGGNPRAVSADGRYRGKYQFDRATWLRWGGSGDAAAAPESVQDRVALRLYRARGTAPWPNCA
jgi:hypothetical protein